MLTTIALAAAVSVTSQCGQLADLAESVMEARQSGVPMRRMMEITDDTESTLFETMVQDAYSEPRYTTGSVKRGAVLDFTDRWYLECVRVMRD